MFILYNIFIWLYYSAIYFASLINPKAKLWIEGRKGVLSKLKKQIKKEDKIIWIHCASLGEFEQGRPIIEKIKSTTTEVKILLTFFSPSGFEVRKNYDKADFIYYLPIDSPQNAKQFIDIVNPQYAIFIKYEFWFNYINQLYKNTIPIYLVSAIFRNNQYFFKPYAKWARKQLKKISFFFVQNEESKKLLDSIEVRNSIITGDTRFDRVFDIAQNTIKYPIVDTFKQNKKILIVGSAWQMEEELISKMVNESEFDIKYIIAPHNINKDEIDNFIKSINKFIVIKFSEATLENVVDAKVLVIDGIGFLFNLYQYGDIALIGGGFGKSIHNVLEPATFGMPVLFGPKHDKFEEAKELIRLKGAFCINNYDEFKSIIENLLKNNSELDEKSNICKNFVFDNKGATDIIIKHLQSSK